MLKMIVDRQLLVIALGIFTALGIISKVVVNGTLKRLVRAAGNMSKSNHPLMRLVRAKFEHACMVSEKVENVEVFVDKYLYEYRIFGVRFHSIRRLENAAALLCIATGLLGSVLTYMEYGMTDRVLQIGAIGAGLGILVYVFHLTTDENYRLQMARNYMVDYLQNVCLHRYEKAYQKDLEAKNAILNQAAEADEDEFEEEELMVTASNGQPQIQPEIQPEIQPKGRQQPESEPEPWGQPEKQPEPTVNPYPVPDTVPPIRGAGEQITFAKKAKIQEEKEQPDRMRALKVQESAEGKYDAENDGKDDAKEIRIRQILEEFMA